MIILKFILEETISGEMEEREGYELLTPVFGIVVQVVNLF